MHQLEAWAFIIGDGERLLQLPDRIWSEVRGNGRRQDQSGMPSSFAEHERVWFGCG